MDADVTIAAVGDVCVDREDPRSIFEPSLEALRGADIRFCQLETPYSDLGSRGSSGRRGAIAHEPSNLLGLAHAGFDVVSLASNHAMDWGEDALLDCADRLRREGLSPIGAGKNREEATTPAILERARTRIAFLSYCSVAPAGYYAADPEKAGVAPMRAHTHYRPIEEDQPGTPCEIHTYPDEWDLAALKEDIGRAKTQADVVVVSFHWGIHRIRTVIADYQFAVARSAIDAGADVILGHHPHKLKAVETYRGKAIFYSIGNFAFDRRYRPNRDFAWNDRVEAFYHSQHGVGLRPREGYTFENESKMSMVAKIRIADRAVVSVSFMPVVIGSDARPVVYSVEDPEGAEVTEYLRAVTDEVGLPTELKQVGDEMLIVTDGR